jgi:hypothetical protein
MLLFRRNTTTTASKTAITPSKASVVICIQSKPNRIDVCRPDWSGAGVVSCRVDESDVVGVVVDYATLKKENSVLKS